ncbi:MAG: YggT family protein [Candidatus Aureabacteria bacterium]|nr:YggT family protein [Candidatus Auribacterota bacterium]
MINFFTLVINLYMLAIVIRAIYSWTQPYPRGQLARVINAITDPVLSPLRRSIPPIAGRIDISPLIVLIFAEIIKRFLANA